MDFCDLSSSVKLLLWYVQVLSICTSTFVLMLVLKKTLYNIIGGWVLFLRRIHVLYKITHIPVCISVLMCILNCKRNVLVYGMSNACYASPCISRAQRILVYVGLHVIIHLLWLGEGLFFSIGFSPKSKYGYTVSMWMVPDLSACLVLFWSLSVLRKWR